MNYRAWVFLLVGMATAAMMYLFYENWVAVRDNLTAPCPTTSTTPETNESAVLVNADEVTLPDPDPTPYLGIEADDLDPTIAEQLGVGSNQGVLIKQVISGSPADEAELERGDVIISFNNRPVNNLDELKAQVAQVEPADSARVVYIRDGDTDSTHVVMGIVPRLVDVAGSGPATWGVMLGALTDDLKEMYDIPDEVSGVMVLSVANNGLADSLGIKQGDVIMSLDGQVIVDLDGFFDAVDAETDDISLLDIYSQGQSRYVSIAAMNLDDVQMTDPISLDGERNFEILLEFVPLIGVFGLIFALLSYYSLFGASPGDATMQTIAKQIRSGTVVFLKQEYKTTAIFLIVFFMVIWWFLCLNTAMAFLTGALCSMLPGWIGMKAATTANVRTCQSAKEEGMEKAMRLGFKGGAVMGISVASVGVIGVSTYCLVLLSGSNPESLPHVIAGFCLGASFFALFGRVGGGIFTKSADIGADMAGKLEFHLPEDDPRNPAVIADNVGDNVGDVAGMGCDLFESYTSATVATLIMAVKMESLKYIALPLALMGIGLLSCLLAVSLGKWLSNHNDPQAYLRRIVYVANGAFLVGAMIATTLITDEFKLFLVVLSGVLCGILIGIETEYFGSGLPVRYIVRMSQTGAATNVIAGLSVGFIGAWLPILTICATIVITLSLSGLYGIGLSAVAMLASMGIIMSIDAYGPIVDNAGGIATMAKLSPEVRRVTDKLDMAGNITAAIGKGFNVAAGVVTAVALFAAFVHGTQLSDAELFTPAVIVGLFIGVALPFVFAAWTMNAVTRIANKMILEIRRQFREVKGLLLGTAEADANRCIEIIAKDSLIATMVAGSIAIASPFVVFWILGIEALGGFLVGAMLTGSVLGMCMSIGGVAWDNAKKQIEQQRAMGHDVEEAFSAALVGDMVGDPFKDVSGPAMNILVKLMVTIALVFCTTFFVSH